MEILYKKLPVLLLLTYKFINSKIYAEVHLEEYAVMVNFMCQFG